MTAAPRVPLTPRRTVLLVARREFTSQIRSRSFVVGLVVTLVLFAGIALLTTFVSGQSSSRSLGVTPGAAALRADLEQAARARELTLTIRDVDDAPGRTLVGRGDLDALLTGVPGDYRLVGRDAVDTGLAEIVSATVAQQGVRAALAGAGLDVAQVDRRSQLATSTLEPVDPARGQQLALALVGTTLLFFSLSGYGQIVASGVVEEKQSRVVELLLATIRPWQLLAGKILGLGAVGLAQLVVLGLVGVLGAGAFGLLTVPGAAAGMFAMVIGWYLLGFFLFASLYAAIGSTVSRQEELNTVVGPMILVLVLPFILVANLLPDDPRNGLAAALSFIPFFSQTVMPARYALGVAPLWQVGIAALLEIAALVVVVRVAGRVYRNSILHTGSRVGLRDALRG